MTDIKLEKVRNTRDLSGIACAGGKHPAPGRLIRGSALWRATDEDIRILLEDYRLSCVIDLRTDGELARKPTPYQKFPGVRFVHASVLEWATVGVSHDEASQEQRQRFLAHPELIMQGHYVVMLCEPHGIQAFRCFFATLLEEAEKPDGGAILWHCMGGKDRTGLATVLLLHALGASWDDICADYLLTNRDLKRDGSRASLLKDYNMDEDMAGALAAVNSAQLSYVDAAIEAVCREYGSLDAYLEIALGIGAVEKAKLREAFLV